jgi:chromosomal replication initiator protein
MELWDRFLLHLQKDLGEKTVKAWIEPIRIAKFDAANLYLEAPDSFSVSWFEEHIRPRLKAKPLVNNNGRQLRVHINAQALEPIAKITSAKNTSLPYSLKADPLEQEFTFDHFVITENNKIVIQMIQENIDLQIPLFNPLFLHGPKRSGKTHLLSAIAQALTQKGKKVFFVNATTFTEHVVQSLRFGTMDRFRQTYRSLDVLIVDDVFQLRKKNATQEEFFHTFNELHTQGKWIILSSELPPSRLEEIEPRLISRFEWGISFPLHPAPPELILEKKKAFWKLDLSPTLIPYLIDHFPNSFEKALQTLALRSQGKGTLTPLIADKLLNDLKEEEKQTEWTHEMLIRQTASHFGIRKEDILGDKQSKDVALPRQIAMYLCRQKLKMAYQLIGKLFNRDHSTVMSSVRQIEKKLISNEPELASILHSITK